MDSADNPIADQLYVDIFDHSPFGIYTLDQEGVITSFNPKMAELSGDKSENAIGLNATHLDSYKEVGLDQLFLKAIAGEPFETEVEYASHLANKKTVRRYRGVPIEDRGIVGQARLLLIVEDITERKLIEKELKKFAQFTAENTNPLLRVALDGRILLINKVAEEIIQTLQGVQDPTLPKPLLEPIKKSLTEGKTYSVDLEYQDKIILFEIVPVMQADAGYANVYGRDVSEERNMQKIKDQFLSITSHELRTPMTVIRGYIELMLQGRVGDLNEKQRGFLEKILENTKSLIEFVNVTLDINKLESGAVSLNLEQVDLSVHISKSVEGIRNLFDEGKINLVYEPVSIVAPIEPPQFERVITNLLSNALKFTPPEGTVSVITMQHEGNAIIGVKDTGVGISAEDQKILFQKYAQIDNAWVSKMRGTGLGLVISKDLIEKMNGKMWVESEVGQGSTFFVSLPMS
ncbi:hypothetical protein A3F64_02075 [Candidatus Saccharibacteria bacterium RIFCSPHIGHO2_12_FULL_42_8]|nr:MAG: hypothetical protein A3F64_02075 [Candidatus Saccharibacteria bacterium RIFCSPHIGHO2_12_FULL_42_8]